MDRVKTLYEFGDFQLDTGEKELRHSSGEILAVPPKAFDLLVFFLENPGRLLEKTELMNSVWADSFVEEGNLKIHVHTLRKVLHQYGKEFIETVPRRGYRFNADIRDSAGVGMVVEKITRSKLVVERKEADTGNSLSLSNATTRTRGAFLLTGLAVSLILGAAIYFWIIRPRNTVTAVPRPTTIAVLPFRNLTGNKSDDFLSIGLTDALTMKLSGLRGLIVRPTSSVLSYASRQETPQKVASELKVEAFLDGTIQRLGDRIRVSLQLVSSADDHVVWTGSFEEQDEDLFKFQDAFSTDIADAFQYKVSSDELATLKRLDTTNPEAYRLYLTARYYFSQYTGDSLQRAIDLYQQAITLDDRYALAYAGIGESYMVLGESTISAMLPDEAYRHAIEPTQKALELDPDLANAYSVLGNIQAKHTWDIPGSERSYRRAIELNPNYADVHDLLAWTLIRESRFEDADAEFRRATELDPSSVMNAGGVGYASFFAGDYNKAILQFQDAVDRDKNFWGAHMNLWRALHHAGRYDEAMVEITACEKIAGPGIPVTEMAKGRTLALQGKVKEAREILNKLVARKEKGEYISPLFLAILAADLNDRDAVFHWLDECFVERNDYMPLLSFAPEFTKYRDDPHFSDLLDQIKPL